MAKPDLDNGHYLQLSHEILERLIHCNLSSREVRAVLYVIRMTYGFKRKEAEISSSDLADFIRIDAGDARRTLASLCERRILIRYSGHKGVKPASYGLEKDWERWDFRDPRELPELIASRGVYTTTKKAQGGSNHHDKQGENTTTNMVKTPRLTGSKHHDYVSKDTEQIEPATRGRKKKEERRNNTPLTPVAGGEGGVEVFELRIRIREAMVRNGWTPSRKELSRATDLVASPTPIGWDKTAWRKHVFRSLIELCEAIKAEAQSGKTVYAPIALACERLRNQVQMDQMLPPPRKEAI